MKSDFILAFNEIAEMRKLPRDVIMEALQAALVSAYRRNSGVSSAQLVEARVDNETGMPTIWVEKEVVEEVESEQTEISLDRAKRFESEAQIGEMIMVESTPKNFGRIAAQTAKQVILQRMREAERDAQFQEYQERVGDLVTGTIQSDSGNYITVGLGRTEAILPHSQQMPGERYHIHSKVRAYVMDVRKTNRGPQIIVSRTHRKMLHRLLEYEVPEIYNGTVEIKSIAREPGYRSKVAVAALQEGADPVGACVGMRGVRIQSIVKELNNEKIDVIEWNADQKVFISKALSPARVNSVFLDDDPDEGRTAVVVVPDDQLSLAIGQGGQNARLAAKLTGWRIDIKSITEATQEALDHLSEEEELFSVLEGKEELLETITHIMEKKTSNKPIMPEDYDVLINFTNAVEEYRLSLREADRSERRRDIESARSQVPEPAYGHPLDDTDLPLRVYNVLVDSGYQTVGEVMEHYYLDKESLLDLNGFGPSALESVEEMVDAVLSGELLEIEEVTESTPEEEVTDEVETPQVETEEVEDEELVAQVEEELEPVETTEEVQPQQEQAIVDWGEEDEARARRAALVAELTGQTEIIEETLPAELAEQIIPEVVAEIEKEEEYRREAENVANYDEDVEKDSEADEDIYASEKETDKTRDKRKRRQLVYDEDLGRVVAKRKRKRGSKDWEEFDIDDLDDF